MGWAIAISIGGLVAGLLAVAVYSPLLALRTVTVDGNVKVSAEDVHAAIDEQMGTPLALLDYESLKSKLDVYPLIRSFSTEIVPPSTLKIHVVERAPMGIVSSSSGFQVIDPAGVVLESVLRRPDGIPLIDLAGQGTDSVAFFSVVDVMLALPESIRSRVDVIQATSQDDVRLVLVGAGQRVTWGSSDRSALKARVLEELMATQEPNVHVEFDVSAPLSPVVRRG
ncbi:MAG: FtsQ-type POTRA domain-containing protein [Terrimesophilobacter sp.]